MEVSKSLRKVGYYIREGVKRPQINPPSILYSSWIGKKIFFHLINDKAFLASLEGQNVRVEKVNDKEYRIIFDD